MALIPVAVQYQQFSKEQQGFLVLFQIGEFYEILFDDARWASVNVGLHLTAKGSVPMCGFPIGSLNQNLKKILQCGRRVVLVGETGEKPVKRKVVKYFSPATSLEEDLQLDEMNSFIASIIVKVDGGYQVAYFDFLTNEEGRIDCEADFLLAKIASINPKEIICVESLNVLICPNPFILKDATTDCMKNIFIYAERFFGLKPLKSSLIKSENDFCLLDSGALKIIHPKDIKREQTLFGHLDKTHTSFGKRLLYKSIMWPLAQGGQILQRQEIVKQFMDNEELKTGVSAGLFQIGDLGKIANRIYLSKYSSLDFKLLFTSLFGVLATSMVMPSMFGKNQLFLLNELVLLLQSAIWQEDDLMIFKPSFNPVLEHMNNEMAKIRAHMLNCKVRLHGELAKKNCTTTVNIVKRTGLGYLFEVKKLTCSFPSGTEFAMQNGSSTFLSSKELTDLTLKETLLCDKIKIAEGEVMADLAKKITSYKSSIDEVIKQIALIDMCLAFAIVSKQNNYTRPTITDDVVVFNGSYHPMLKSLIGAGKTITNNIELNSKNNLMLLFGANMSGKSTVLRQLVVLQVMVQIGCFVPAASATTICANKILTRIGSGDDIYNEKSTFFTEMDEVAKILKHGSHSSLCIIDEIGRGTVYEEGLAIASAVARWINDNGVFALFATHYYGLLREEFLCNLNKTKVSHMRSVKTNDKIEFTHKVEEGIPSEKISHAFYVAKLAGVPQKIIDDAKKTMA